MAKARYYHVYIVGKKGVKLENIQKKMDLALGWFRYDRKNWIVYSTSDINKWMSRLQPLVKPDGSLFICAFDVTYHNGWMTEDFWKWIKDLS